MVPFGWPFISHCHHTNETGFRAVALCAAALVVRPLHRCANLVAAAKVQTSLEMMGEAEQCHGA
jgi:hypothetical protein